MTNPLSTPVRDNEQAVRTLERMCSCRAEITPIEGEEAVLVRDPRGNREKAFTWTFSTLEGLVGMVSKWWKEK